MKWKKLAAAALCAAAVWGLAASVRAMADYVQAVKAQAGAGVRTYAAPQAAADGKADALLERIKAAAPQYAEPPVDAVVDRVWHAIPGYNGVELDIERTYAAMRLLPEGAPIRPVLREIEPKVGLDDLGPHPIYRGNPKKRMAALMINVAWGNEHLPSMLETLKAKNVRATFFFDGSWLEKNETLARQIAEGGHELSNHAYSHPDMAKLGRNEQYRQIARTEALLKEKLGVRDNKWFAPPSGSYNATTVRTAAQLGLKTVLWTVDTVDWKSPPPENIVAKIRRDAGPGSLILMHPTASASAALADMIDVLRSKGIEPGTVSRTLSTARVPPVEPAL
ncbi:putative xylanase/chitin deacetylase [Thermobacillus composti KWC4]|uniref:Putative xylanase/chitin deacetylase n=1 Tax=Thermobacillus composti (strain DSM 18247 / JCM 13945 / KWC4) TaxID=717605 RepID=L0EEE0_THECK|nr:polysaccharide deacetylase family protein [Thermobacillus composti]AGA58172.1 putative xylanase/chitin deacetylase [Thermobacillus composti KWC4]